MSGKLLLFGFEELPAILAAAAAAGPFGADVVPVARQDLNKSLAVLAGLDEGPGDHPGLVPAVVQLHRLAVLAQ